MEAELLCTRCAILAYALAAGFTTVNWLSLTVQQFVRGCDEVYVGLLTGTACFLAGTSSATCVLAVAQYDVRRVNGRNPDTSILALPVLDSGRVPKTWPD